MISAGQKVERHISGHARAARLGTEFVAAIAVGTGMGYFADTMLGTSPWIMLVMMLAGFAAGVLNVVRSAAEMNASAGIAPDTVATPKTGQSDSL